MKKIVWKNLKKNWKNLKKIEKIEKIWKKSKKFENILKNWKFFLKKFVKNWKNLKKLKKFQKNWNNLKKIEKKFEKNWKKIEKIEKECLLGFLIADPWSAQNSGRFDIITSKTKKSLQPQGIKPWNSGLSSQHYTKNLKRLGYCNGIAGQ